MAFHPSAVAAARSGNRRELARTLAIHHPSLGRHYIDGVAKSTDRLWLLDQFAIIAGCPVPLVHVA